MQNRSASRFCPGGFSAGAKSAEALAIVMALGQMLAL